jgi:parallel beta-helix repeat protein
MRPPVRLLLLAATALSVCAALVPATAGAAMATQAAGRIEVFRPATGATGATMVFRLRRLRANSVKGAYVKLGSRNRRLPVKRIRTAVKRGVLRLRAPQRRSAAKARLYVRTTVDGDGYVVPADAYHVAPTGSDSNPGTAGLPWRTLDHAAEAAHAGDTVAVHAGTYARAGAITRLDNSGSAGKPITFVGMPGEDLPRVLGQLRIDGDYVEVRRLLVDGPTGHVAQSSSDNPGGEDVEVWIRGSHTMLADSEIRDGHWHAGVYVSENPRDVMVLRNHVHDNGDFGNPSQANLDHGIYWDSGSGRVAGNLVEHNLAYGVHLYPDASGVVVEDNTIRGHGRDGVIIADHASRNIIRGNLVTGNRLGIRGYDLSGTGNVVQDNQVLGNREGDLGETGGLILRGNITG